MGMKRIEFGFWQRSVAQSELYRNIIKPARREAAIKMPHSRNDHPHNRNVDVRPCLIEDKEVPALPLGQTHAGTHLLARVETAHLRAKARLDRWIVAWSQKGMVLYAQRSGPIKARLLSSPASSHEADGQELIQFGQRAEQGDSGIKVCAGPELDVFLRVVHPMHYCHKARNPKVAGDVQHPKPASGFGELALQITDVGIVELARDPVEKIQEAGRKMFKAFVAQRPDR